jgi:hypothetical protein
MTNWTWWTHNDSHPSERDLLLYVNGEGGARLARRVRDHVEGCWSCSLKRDRLAGAIAAFMRERETGLGTEDLSERADRRFESKLRRLAQEAESADAASRPRPGRSPLGIPLQTVAALSLVVAIIFLFWIRFSSVPSVSAREILNRAEHAEARRIAEVNEPVIHQQFQVTRLANGLSPESTYLEIWHDPKSNRWRQETEEAAEVVGVLKSKTVAAKGQPHTNVRGADHRLVAELQEILKTNDMHRQPISASAFAGWRSRLKRSEEHITETSLENGDKALTITTSAAEPLPRNAIVKAEFVVRTQDWHPVQHRLSVAEDDGLRSYEIRETSFEVVALGSLGASIFEPPVLPSPVTLASSPNRVSLSESPVDALELEIALLHRLHEAKACLGEEVQIVTGASAKPEVRGVVASAERKQQLTRLFAEFPDVAVVLQVPGGDEPARSTAPSETPKVPAAEAETQGDTGSSPIKDHLLAYFAQLDLTPEARRARSIEFSNRVITQSESADLHAWALRRLAERFNTMSLEKLSPSAVAKFQSMARDHLRALSNNVGHCDEMLRPVLASLGNGEDAGNSTLTSSAPEGENWPSRFMRMFESVTTADRLILGLFDGAGSNASVFESSSALLVGLPKILEGIREAESQLSELASPYQSQVISAQPNQRPVP